MINHVKLMHRHSADPSLIPAVTHTSCQEEHLAKVASVLYISPCCHLNYGTGNT